MCCGKTIVRKSGRLPVCCGTQAHDATQTQCVDGYVHTRTNLGSTCCRTEIGWKCCEDNEGCCEHEDGSGEIVVVPGFRPACCDVADTGRQAECCSITMEKVGVLPACCEGVNVKPVCCRSPKNGNMLCCSAGTGQCCGQHPDSNAPEANKTSLATLQTTYSEEGVVSSEDIMARNSGAACCTSRGVWLEMCCRICKQFNRKSYCCADVKAVEQHINTHHSPAGHIISNHKSRSISVDEKYKPMPNGELVIPLAQKATSRPRTDKWWPIATGSSTSYSGCCNVHTGIQHGGSALTMPHRPHCCIAIGTFRPSCCAVWNVRKLCRCPNIKYSVNSRDDNNYMGHRQTHENHVDGRVHAVGLRGSTSYIGQNHFQKNQPFQYKVPQQEYESYNRRKEQGLDHQVRSSPEGTARFPIDKLHSAGFQLGKSQKGPLNGYLYLNGERFVYSRVVKKL